VGSTRGSAGSALGAGRVSSWAPGVASGIGEEVVNSQVVADGKRSLNAEMFGEVGSGMEAEEGLDCGGTEDDMITSFRAVGVDGGTVGGGELD